MRYFKKTHGLLHSLFTDKKKFYNRVLSWVIYYLLKKLQASTLETKGSFRLPYKTIWYQPSDKILEFEIWFMW